MENRIYHLRKMETDNQLLRLALKRELLFNIISLYDNYEEHKESIEKLTTQDIEDMTDILLHHDYLNETRNEIITNILEERGIE